MDFQQLRELNSSPRIATHFSLDELVAGARQFRVEESALWARRLAKEKGIKDLNVEPGAINAIGLKLRDDKLLSTSAPDPSNE